MQVKRVQTARKPVGSGSLGRPSVEYSPPVGQLRTSPYVNAASPVRSNDRPISQTSEEFYDTEPHPSYSDHNLASHPASQQLPHPHPQQYRQYPHQYGQYGQYGQYEQPLQYGQQYAQQYAQQFRQQYSPQQQQQQQQQQPHPQQYPQQYPQQQSQQLSQQSPQNKSQYEDSYGYSYANTGQYFTQPAAQPSSKPHGVYGYSQSSIHASDPSIYSRSTQSLASVAPTTPISIPPEAPTQTPMFPWGGIQPVRNPSTASRAESNTGSFAESFAESRAEPVNDSRAVSRAGSVNDPLSDVSGERHHMNVQQQQQQQQQHNHLQQQPLQQPPQQPPQFHSQYQPQKPLPPQPQHQQYNSARQAPRLNTKLSSLSISTMADHSMKPISTPSRDTDSGPHAMQRRASNISTRSGNPFTPIDPHAPASPATSAKTTATTATTSSKTPTTPATSTGTDENKDESLGIGIGSMYVQKLRSEATETHIPKMPASLPLGLRRSTKSAQAIQVKPEFLRRAMDIRYKHLPRRMLETEVDDDDHAGNNANGMPSLYPSSSGNRPAGSFTSQTEEAPPRPNSPAESIIEQTGKIKLFVANPDSD